MTQAIPPLLVLGAGYVGRALLANNSLAAGTHRPGHSLAPNEYLFDLADPATWNALPTQGRHVIWTFPAVPLETVQDFHHRRLRNAASVIVLGSTSAYIVQHPDETVTEETTLDLAQPRVAGEEWLRAQGATVLHLAGIFGPGREPVRWLEKGLIKNGRKRVNLIHVADIVNVVLALTRTPKPGLRLNVSNGKSPTWNELVAIFRERGWLPPEFALPEFEPGIDSKRIDNRRLQALLPGSEWLAP